MTNPLVVDFDIGHSNFSIKHMRKVLNRPVLDYIQNGGVRPHPMFNRGVSVTQGNNKKVNFPSTTTTTHIKAGDRSPEVPSRPKSRKEPSLCERTDALLRGLSLILEHHDASERIQCELKLQVHKYLDSSDGEMVWLNRCKYLLCYPLAKYLRNKLPKSPDMSFKPSGPLRGWMKARLNAFNNKNTHLWYSWFQAKRATLPLSDKIVQSSYEKHLHTLTSPDPLNDGSLTAYEDEWEIEEEDRYFFDPFLAENTLKDLPFYEKEQRSFGEKYVDQIFKDPVFRKVLGKVRESVTKDFYKLTKANDNFIDVESFPKTSACFEKKRSEGGQIEELRELCDVNLTDLRGDELYSMEYCPKIFTKKGLFSSVYEKRCTSGFKEWSHDINNLAREAAKDDFPLRCTIQAVLEPNKIRIISKGPALEYYSCKGLQKSMHSAIRKMPMFRLTGRPFFGSDVTDLLAKAKQDWLWCSIDYSAATDGLSNRYSMRILDNIIENLDDNLKRLARRVLGPHRLHYPDDKGEPRYRGTQTNGQLMGSILSFPILCLANFGVYLRSTRKIRQGWTYEETINHVLINGDDMLYAAPESVFLTNVKVGRAVGLEMSVGKAYYHHSYLNINSQSVICDLRRPQDLRTVRCIDFLNVGLFFGQHKVQGRVENDRNLAKAHDGVEEGIVPNINTLLSGSLAGKECLILRKCLEINKETITRECSGKDLRGNRINRNLFISEKLGGMGVHCPSGWKYKTTKSDLYLAHGMVNQYPHLDTDLAFPSKGYPIEDLSTIEPVPFDIRDTDRKDRSFPVKRISFTKLKYFCHSPNFHYISCNQTSLKTKDNKIYSSHGDKRPYSFVSDIDKELNDQLEQELSENPRSRCRLRNGTNKIRSLSPHPSVVGFLTELESLLVEPSFPNELDNSGEAIRSIVRPLRKEQRYSSFILISTLYPCNEDMLEIDKPPEIVYSDPFPNVELDRYHGLSQF